MLLQHKEQLLSKGGAELLAGIAVMIAGLMVCARAGSLKVGDAQVAKTSSSISFGVGLFYCVASGLLSALVNFALIFGAPIAKVALARGVDPATANNSVWALVFTVAYLVNLGYCLFKGAQRGTLKKFRSDSTLLYWALAGVMGLLWAGGIVVYGHGASLGGALGPIFGFPIMLIVSILTGNAAGAVSGEWRGAPSVAKTTMACGVIVMILAILTLGYASYAIG
jgi:L-rhamnose-H+ transport protein